MRILIINPNSDSVMTRAILKSAKAFAGNDFKVDCRLTPGAPKFIDTYEDQIKAAPGMIQLLRENEEDFDAFVVACHCDPNLDALKEITGKPVIGIGEASMKIASMLGHRFAVISTDARSIPIKEALIWKYHLQDVAASVRAPRQMPNDKKTSSGEKYLRIAQEAVTEDRADVIVLWCAGMTGLDKRLQETLSVPVLDGVLCALMIASGLVRHGIFTRKFRRTNPQPLGMTGRAKAPRASKKPQEPISPHTKDTES
jgi:allantoin racemase